MLPEFRYFSKYFRIKIGNIAKLLFSIKYKRGKFLGRIHHFSQSAFNLHFCSGLLSYFNQHPNASM